MVRSTRGRRWLQDVNFESEVQNRMAAPEMERPSFLGLRKGLQVAAEDVFDCGDYAE